MAHPRKKSDYRVNWQGGRAWRLESLGEAGMPEVPPKSQEYTHSQLVARTVSILVGEVGGGCRSFQRWLNQESASTEVTITDVPSEDFFREQAIDGKRNFYLDLSHIDRPYTPPSAPLDTFLQNLSGVTQAHFEELGISLVVLARWLPNLRNSYYGSSLLGRGQLYRLPHFDVQELSDWLHHVDEQKQWNLTSKQLEDRAVQLKKLVGGQPKLTDILMQHAYDTCKTGAQLEDNFKDRANRLRTFPPECVSEWKTHLRALIEKPEVYRLVRAYVTGSTKHRASGELDTHDLDLFIAGWVGTGPEDTWGIRSEVHRSWAREVL